MKVFERLLLTIAGFLLLLTCLHDTAVAKKPKDFDKSLQKALRSARVEPLDTGLPHSTAQVDLGRLLFFDKELSGNRDVACATCHHPLFFTGDDLSLSIGVGGIGLGSGTSSNVSARSLGAGREFIPRNAPEVFNRGSLLWQSQFWDSRVEITRRGELITPAGELLPSGFESLLAAQAMFPVTSRDEMRGAEGENELADISDDDLHGIWNAIMARLIAIPEYVGLFQDAYPDVSPENLGFEHAAGAIGAFESIQLTFLDSPFDLYLEGNKEALSDSAKRGALLFYGKARCSECHSGSLLTDQKHHNIGIPPLGPGKLPEKPLDFGRARETGKQKDIYAFRTPPLRNVALTGPWMHNGAYTSLGSAILHHLDAEQSLRSYDSSQLDVRLQGTVIDAPEVIEDIVITLDRKIKRRVKLKDDQLIDLEEFLYSLTSQAVASGALLLPETFPLEVPSGLPVDGAEFFAP